MARIVLDDSNILIRLPWWEQLAARRREVRVPVSALREVHIEPDWWRALRGVAGKGAWIPARRCVGVRHLQDGNDFVSIRADGPVLCVELRRWAPFRRLAVSDPHPEEAMRKLQPFIPRDRLG